MDKVAFANLLFRIEELLAEVDYWRRLINDCTECRGWGEEDYTNMCPSCLKALYEEFEALKKVSEDVEFKEASIQIRKALDDDATGELAEIFRLSRRATVN